MEDKILMMHRHPDKLYGLTWGLPAGKVEAGETPLQAALREVKEETGIALDPGNIERVGSMHIQVKSFDFIFHVFYAPLKVLPSVQNDDSAHIDWRFVTIEEAKELPRILGGSETFEIFVNYKKQINKQ